jgi:hypothetical protein
METETIAKPIEAHCSFCRKGQDDVDVLVAGIGVMICDECVDLAAAQVASARPVAKKVPYDAPKHSRSLESERLLKLVSAIEPIQEEAAAHQALWVEILRERGVSWADIGGALNVSRQAVWKRFARGPETD